MAHVILLVSLLSLILTTSVSANEISGDVMEIINRLEANDREHKREISSLNSKINEMEKDFLKRETDLLQKINQLEDKVGEGGSKYEEDQDNEEAQPDFIQQNGEDVKRLPLKERRSSIERQIVETEVAFYATHSKHDILHLGQDQIIPFNQTVTNIGNAYNTHHGAFFAPVDGTYVFHVTLMGTLHNATNRYYVAHIDVDDVGYSKFYIIPYEQSSHMLVIELKSGSAVSVKNGRVDDGIVGSHYSAFSGFLLYQHFQSSAIVGK